MAIERGDRGRPLVLRVVQIPAFLKPFNFPVKSPHGVFQQNRSSPGIDRIRLEAANSGR